MSRLWLLALVACTVGDEHHHHDEPVLDLDSALLVRSRAQLSVCVQIDPAIADPSIADKLRDDVQALRAMHADWAGAGLDRGAVEVVVGCPGGAIIEGPLDGKGAGGSVLGPGLVATPSPFRTHVHVIADTRAQTILGAAPFARAIAELAPVDEHRIAEVSTAIVVPVSALGTDAFRTGALAQSVGLAEVLP